MTRNFTMHCHAYFGRLPSILPVAGVIETFGPISGSLCDSQLQIRVLFKQVSIHGGS
jgi:hypothetical protein